MTPWQSRPHGRVISAHRIAIASGRIEMLPATLALIEAETLVEVERCLAVFLGIVK